MDSKKEKWLLDKYWNAETSLDEEKALRDKSISDASQIGDEVDQNYFSMLSQLSNQELGADFDEDFFQKVSSEKKQNIWIELKQNGLKIAASLLIIISAAVYFINNNNENKAVAVEQDPREAFEITKQALLLVSAKLNRGASYTTGAIGKFDEAQEKVKSKNKNI